MRFSRSSLDPAAVVVPGDRAADIHLPGLYIRPSSRDDRVEERSDVHRLPIRDEAALLHARRVEQVGHEHRKPLRFANDALQADQVRGRRWIA